MRRVVGRLLWVALFGLMCVGAHEAQAARRGRKHHRPDVFQTYDENKNRKLDPAERDRIERDFNEDERLERFDRDGDRKLSDEEIDAIKPQGGKQKGQGGGKK